MCAEKYNETLDFLFNALPVWERVADGAAYKPGTERVLAFAEAVGSPHLALRTVHIAGTNGKGSTASMLAAILQSAGLRVGLYTSPHLVDFRERIRVDGAMIPPEAVVEFAASYRTGMVRLGMTFFEMATVMAFWWFSRSGVDIAVIETGLGGRHDATNIITPVLSIVTNIGLEHTKYLGATLAAIASEKAGIIKPHVPVVIGQTTPETSPVFLAAAARAGSPIVFAGGDEVSFAGGGEGSFAMDLQGIYQQKNLRTVLAAVDVLRTGGLSISDAAIRTGLANTTALTGLRGRWETIGEPISAGSDRRSAQGDGRRPTVIDPRPTVVADPRPTVVVDTAHNPHGFEQIALQLARWRADNPSGRIWMVLGFAADKDVATIARHLPPDARLILTAADSPRSMPVEELARRMPAAETAPSVAAAVALARKKASPDDLIYVGGSNFVVGEFLKSCS